MVQRHKERMEIMNAQKALFERLQPWLDEERCRTCECVQAGLLQLEFNADNETAASAVAYRVSTEQTHS